MIKSHLIYSTVLLVSICLINWSKFSIVKIKKESITQKIKNYVYVIVMTYLPLINVIILMTLMILIFCDEERVLEICNSRGVEYKLKNKSDLV